MISKRKLLSVLFVFLLSLSFFMCDQVIKAHEIYYDGYGPAFNPIPVSWHHRSSGKAYLKISNNGLTEAFNGIDALLVLGYANLVTTDNILLWTPADAKSA